MDYDILYSARRTVCITVKDKRVVVKAPFFTSKSRLDELVLRHERWIEKQLQRQKNERLKDSMLTDEQIAQLRKSARHYLTAKTKEYAENMGLKFGRITITSAKTRFGSCSSSGNISYSWRLMLYPTEAIDYVVVHELSHIVEMNHSKRFWAIVEGVLPDYKERKKLLLS